VRDDSRMVEKRDCAIDFVKGVLVEVMIVYHTMNYFVGAQSPVLKYLDFVSGGFIFITGYVISAFYTMKYKADPLRMYLRLFLRGGKIVLLFTFVNLAINLVFQKNYNNAELGVNKFIENLYPIYVLGYKQIAAFEILLPIAYVLIISPLLLAVSRWRNLLLILISTMFLYCSLTPSAPFNLLYLSIGLNGFALGLLFKSYLAGHASDTSYNRQFICLAVLYFGLIALWERTFLSYALGVIAISCALYFIGCNLNYNTRVLRTVVLCGQYSLLAYLSQIIVLQGVFRLGKYFGSPGLLPISAFIITNVVVIVICEGVALNRGKSQSLDRVYRTIFT
jgi:hypothetical protein